MEVLFLAVPSEINNRWEMDYNVQSEFGFQGIRGGRLLLERDNSYVFLQKYFSFVENVINCISCPVPQQIIPAHTELVPRCVIWQLKCLKCFVCTYYHQAMEIHQYDKTLQHLLTNLIFEIKWSQSMFHEEI